MLLKQAARINVVGEIEQNFRRWTCHYQVRNSMARTLSKRAIVLGHLDSNDDIRKIDNNDQTEMGLNRRHVLSGTLLLSMNTLYTTPAIGSEHEMIVTSSNESIRSEYDSYAKTYDDLDGGIAANVLGFPKLRRGLLGEANGAVLECAIGTGLNLPFYDFERLTSLTGIDISDGMLVQAKDKARYLRKSEVPLNFVQGDVSNMEMFADGFFDTVVDTFSLCVFPDPVSALKEMSRVVKQDGKVLLLEHNRSDGLLGLYQDITAEPVTILGGKGCVYNQDVKGLVKQAGMEIIAQQEYLGGLIIQIIAKKLT